jgi:hypothetical protein
MLMIGALALVLAAPVLAATKTYNLSGDQSTKFPTDGTILRPNTVFGSSVIEDDGGGTPTLTSLSVINKYTDSVGGTTTSGIPGTTVKLDSTTTAGPTGGQTGAGTTSTTITWGSLSGWTQTGTLECTTFCAGTPGCPTGTSSCIPFVGFEGLGPPAPLSSGSFDLGTQAFAGDMSSFTSNSREFVNLVGGAVTGNLVWDGALVTVPLLPLAAFGGLGAGMVFLGSRALRRKND